MATGALRYHAAHTGLLTFSSAWDFLMVRTRFAPSPTGYLHIGGVRTALFNWLFARRRGGQFILRIDDTDQQRNVSEALQPLLDGFRWLGLHWDEGAEVRGPYGPYYQSQKLARYQAAIRELVEKGFAYWDYATVDELQAEGLRPAPTQSRQRQAADQAQQPYRYSRRWMAETPAARARFEDQGRQGVVRLQMPREGHCVFDDHIRGRVEVAWAEEQDHVIQRADGTVLYNLASVVDDYDMQITHVIRAAEHLSNTPRQIFIAQGLGYPLPQYAHRFRPPRSGRPCARSCRRLASASRWLAISWSTLYFFVADEYVRYDEAAFAQRLRMPPQAAGILRRAQASLQTIEPFHAATLEQWLQDLIQAEGIRHGQIVHALRVAVTSKATGFGLFDSLAILGKLQCLARIERALAQL
jgi:glutamyl/glutaminyl-tRNA synthetase